LRQSLIGDPAVVAQRFKDGAVDVIEALRAACFAESRARLSRRVRSNHESVPMQVGCMRSQGNGRILGPNQDDHQEIAGFKGWWPI